MEQSLMDNLTIYNEVRSVPDSAKRRIEAGRADEVTGLLAARRAVPEKVVGAPCNVRPFELAAVPVVGRIDDQRAFRSLDEYEPWLFVLDDFLPVDVLLVARDVQSPDGKVVRGFLAA